MICRLSLRHYSVLDIPRGLRDDLQCSLPFLKTFLLEKIIEFSSLKTLLIWHHMSFMEEKGEILNDSHTELQRPQHRAPVPGQEHPPENTSSENTSQKHAIPLSLAICSCLAFKLE